MTLIKLWSWDLFLKEGRGTAQKALVPRSVGLLLFDFFRQALDRLNDHIQLHLNPIKQIEGDNDRKANLTDKGNDLFHVCTSIRPLRGQGKAAPGRKQPVFESSEPTI